MSTQFSDMLKQPLQTSMTPQAGSSTPLDPNAGLTQTRVARSSAPTSSNSDSGFSTFEQQVIDLTNQERAKQGLAPLKMDSRLNDSAEKHSQDMAAQNYFSHQGKNGSQPWDRMEDSGYGNFARAAENIALGQTSAQQVVSDWMNSPGHRRNILDPNLKDLGVGYFNGYWTQNFGTLMSNIA
jgi:uncharacterized protein YkwD